MFGLLSLGFTLSLDNFRTSLVLGGLKPTMRTSVKTSFIFGQSRLAITWFTMATCVLPSPSASVKSRPATGFTPSARKKCGVTP